MTEEECAIWAKAEWKSLQAGWAKTDAYLKAYPPKKLETARERHEQKLGDRLATAESDYAAQPAGDPEYTTEDAAQFQLLINREAEREAERLYNPRPVIKVRYIPLEDLKRYEREGWPRSSDWRVSITVRPGMSVLLAGTCYRDMSGSCVLFMNSPLEISPADFAVFQQLIDQICDEGEPLTVYSSDTLDPEDEPDVDDPLGKP
jgi:hypothetical protein